MGRLKKILPVFLTTGAVLACFVLMIVPFPRTLGVVGETVDCIWEDGTLERMAYAEALAYLDRIGGSGNLVLLKDGMRGTVETGEELKAAQEALTGSSLLALRTLDASDLTSLEKTALFREHADTVWYAGEAFGFDGAKVFPKKAEYAKKVVLLSGALPPNYLKQVGASVLRLTENAEFTATALVGSKIESVTAETPFYIHGVGIYCETPSGMRLVAALPKIAELVVEDCAFADRGALVACQNLTRLTLPFAGSGAEGGELAWLFQTADDYFVPEGLRLVTITGGRLASHCFYNCPNVEEITVCGIAPENIDRQAFLGATNLRYLHTPRKDVELEGNYTSRTADCGCTIYERSTS